MEVKEKYGDKSNNFEIPQESYSPSKSSSSPRKPSAYNTWISANRNDLIKKYKIKGPEFNKKAGDIWRNLDSKTKRVTIFYLIICQFLDLT